MKMEGQDERTFLCGYQRTRGYGSLSNLQMSEIKRLNRLWSNESLYLKEYVEIPIYDEILEKDHASTISKNIKNNRRYEESKKSQNIEGESLQDIFKRIDMNIRKTTCCVHKLTENSTADLLAGDLKIEFMRRKPEFKLKDPRSLHYHSSGFQNETYQN
ncbi:unnamed protein product [Litomosoides sigmodontis]|uniref:LysM domain-containing protein n=1 Tax=Litomosoides sigmodontis TaxID=42156 RepID=A0A3P7JK81_LITSI|nr:unnamed protein product [Litomosoides sigmodontis]